MRNGLRLALGLLILLPVARVGRAEPAPEKPDSFRCRLEGSVPSILSFEGLPPEDYGHGATWVARIGGQLEAIRTQPNNYWRRLTRPSEILRNPAIVLPSGPSNRPTVIDARVMRTGIPDTKYVGQSAPDIPLVERFLWNDDLVFGSVAGAKSEVYDRDFPRGFLAKIAPQGDASIDARLPAPGVGDDARVTIRVSLAPTHEGLVQLGATWGAKSFAPVAAVRGVVLSTVSFSCDGRDVPKDGAPLVLHDATTSIPPTTPEDTSDDRGAIWIDSVEVRAPIVAADDIIRIETEPGVVVRLAVVRLVDVAKAHFDAPDPVAAAKGADEVILTTTATAAGAARLAAHRSTHGVNTIAIPFADVVDRLGYGTCDPEIVGRYISQLAADGTSPKFLLLAGDAMRDVVDDPTTSIPTAYGRTMYNGATASDRLLVRAGLEREVKPPSVGRLPFRDAATMDAYVDRIIAYETKPPADATRRLVRFVTSEGRFGPLIDGLLQNLFENIVNDEIPKAYDVEVTFASATSAYCWPPSHFHEKVIGGLNDGALFYTYVGHGWAEGFDSLHVGNARYPILRSKDVPDVDVKGTPPAMFVVACTTATFDDPDSTGVGELLLARPHGPLAYWGATRVCHPAWNSFIGRQIAMTIFKDPNRRIGEVLDAAVKGVLEPDPADKGRKLIEMGARTLTPGTVPLERILEEGSWMYTLLGDPAVKLALPKDDLAVTTAPGEAAEGADRPVKVSVSGPFADGTTVEISIEVPRNVRIGRDPAKGLSPDDAMRARHASSNDKALVRGTASAKGGIAEMMLVVPVKWKDQTLYAKAWCIAGGDVHQGFATATLAK